MSNTQTGEPAELTWKKIVRRALTTLLLAAFVGWLIHEAAAALDRSAQPAGFARGFVQGALMPAAMPNLLVGKDVVIYSANNTGVPYKLGYTMGVNTCGAVFFGIFFVRLNRLRKRLNGSAKKIEPASNRD